MSFSLMNCQMMRVISSPSSSTTGLATLIFAMCAGLPGVTGERAPTVAEGVASLQPEAGTYHPRHGLRVAAGSARAAQRGGGSRRKGGRRVRSLRRHVDQRVLARVLPRARPAGVD